MIRRFDLLASFDRADWPDVLFARLMRRLVNAAWRRWRRFADWEDAPIEIKIHMAIERGDVAGARKLMREAGATEHQQRLVLIANDLDPNA